MGLSHDFLLWYDCTCFLLRIWTNLESFSSSIPGLPQSVDFFRVVLTWNISVFQASFYLLQLTFAEACRTYCRLPSGRSGCWSTLWQRLLARMYYVRFVLACVCEGFFLYICVCVCVYGSVFLALFFCCFALILILGWLRRLNAVGWERSDLWGQILKT